MIILGGKALEGGLAEPMIQYDSLYGIWARKGNSEREVDASRLSAGIRGVLAATIPTHHTQPYASSLRFATSVARSPQPHSSIRLNASFSLSWSCNTVQ